MAGSISAQQVARVVGVSTTFQNLLGTTLALPQRIAVIGQGATASVGYSLAKRQVFSFTEVGDTYGYGSPLYLAVRQLFPANGKGVGVIPVTVYPLNDDGAGAVSTGLVTPTGTVSKQNSVTVRVNNIDSEPFIVSVGDSLADIVTAMTAAINAVIAMPIIAVDGTTKVDFTSKWEGASANDIFVEVVAGATAGITYGVTQPTGGLNNPDVDDALALVGGVWETMFINCMEIADTTTLGKFDVFGEGRWGELVRKPMVAFTGNTIVDVTAASAVADARPLDRTNCQLTAPGSNDLPLVVAAAQIVVIALLADSNPPHDYGGQIASGITPGLDSDQWTNVEKDAAIKRGSSSSDVVDGVVQLSDIVTFYKKTGETPPAFRYVVDIIKLQQVIFNLDLEFNSTKWNGAPLIPDNQTNTNPTAKKPKTAKAAIAAILTGLGLNAIISDPDTAIANVTVQINATNPKRLDICVPIQLSGNTNIIDIGVLFGFFFGDNPVITT